MVVVFYYAWILTIWYESRNAFNTLLGLSAFDS